MHTLDRRSRPLHDALEITDAHEIVSKILPDLRSHFPREELRSQRIYGREVARELNSIISTWMEMLG